MEKVADLVSISREHPAIREDAGKKIARMREWIKPRGLSGVILARADNFAWLTAGGDSRIIESSETGVAVLVITAARQYLVAYRMDATRLLEEQLPGQGYELVWLHWFEGDPLQKAMELVDGPTGADVVLPGTEYIQSELIDLHYPMTPLEVERYRWLGEETGDLMNRMAGWVQPGMTELEIAHEMRAEHARRSLDVDVLIVGSDARVFQFRHPMATHKPLENYLLIHSAARRWGLHANVSRCISFGKPPARLARAWEAAATLEGRLISRLEAGLPFSKILQWQKEWYADLGFPEEWKYHFQGGPTGYVVVDPVRCLTKKVVQVNQPFEWFITITGVKAGELTFLFPSGSEILSMRPEWPEFHVQIPDKTIKVPGLFMR
jgi:antitoxin VapB